MRVRVLVIGDMSALPAKPPRSFERVVARTAGNGGLTLVVALNYGSRIETHRGRPRACTRGRGGHSRPESIDEDSLAAHLYTAEIPDPDLLIRTSGEMRVSNFLLWQIAYSELWVTHTLWPDFDRTDLLRAVVDYEKRDRRFGGR